MKEIQVFAGICGFTTRIEAIDKGAYNATLVLKSECPNWHKVNETLKDRELNVMKELFKDTATGKLNSEVLNIALTTIPHVSCPVISGILKALEVSVGLALPKDAFIKFESE